VVTAEDDPAVASEAQRNEYANFFGKNAQDPYSMPAVAVAVVAPTAAQGLSAFAHLMHGSFDDVAADSWSDPEWLTMTGEGERSALCLEWPVVDVDPTQPGVHPDCRAEERDVSAAGVVARPMPFCQGDAADPDPCWETTMDFLRCPLTGLEFKVVRSKFACMPSYWIQYRITCATKPQ
jgi:hypothetical protein